MSRPIKLFEIDRERVLTFEIIVAVPGDQNGIEIKGALAVGIMHSLLLMEMRRKMRWSSKG